VNLILRARDLGPAGGTHALAAVSSLPIQATLVNGNVHARLALFAVTGSFGVLGAALSYDSLAATRSAAIRRYAALNGRNREQVEAEFGVRVLPDGWSCTLLPTLVPFVDPDGGLENPILRRCLELALDDGNHLVFEETAQAGVYHVRHAAEALDDDADGALSLVLTRTGETFRLGTDDSRYRLFDDRGRLVEDRRGPGETITLDWQDDAITITDPGQQAIRLALEDRRIVRITSPADHTWTLTPREDRLEGLTDPGGNAWRFQAGTDGLLTGVEGPADLPVTLGYYLGRDVEGVPPAVAEKFWGRLARMVQGERSLQVRYGDRAERQEIVVVDPEGHRRRVVYETERQAAVEVDYANNRAPEEYRELRRITYRETSKAPRTLRNHLGGTMHYGYAPQPQWARAHALTSLRAATGGEWFYSRDGRGRVETVTAPGRGTTAYRYQGDTDLVERIELPAVPTLAPGGGPATFAPVETFAYDERERETRTVSMEGVETAFGYGDPPGQSRDPHRRGRVTRVTTAGQTWSYSWDVMGRLERVESPGGHVRRFEYDHAGRIEKVHDADTWVKASYDPLGRLERIEDSLGRASGLTYSAYGEPHVRTDSEGHTVEFASRDRNGNVTRLVLEDGAEHTYQEFDALGRWRRHVPPDVSRNGPQGFVSFPAPAVEADHVDRPEAFPEAGEATLRTVYQVGSVKVTLHRNAAGLPAGEVVEEEGRTRATVTRYDALGEVASVHEFEDGRLLATTLRLERDALGRVTRSEQGGVVTRYGRARDGRGIYQVEAFPAYARQEGGAPSSGMRFDDLGRLVALFDGRGDDVVQYRYDDVARRLEIRAADPSAGDQLRLEPIVVRRFDRRGLVVGEETVAQGPVAARETTWARDGFGRVLTVSARDGEVRTFEYDDLDRVRRVTLTVPAVAAPPLSVGPDPAPPATGPRSAVMEVDYDDAGRVRRRAFADGTSEEVAYDRLGRPASITRRGLGGGVQVEQLFYDRSGELRARWYAPDVYWFVQKDAAGRTLTEVQQMGTRRAERVLVTDGLGAVVGYREAGRDLSFAYGYDDAGRLTEYRIARAGGEVAGLTWDYGPAPGPERLRIRTSQGSREVLWTYDQDQRVVGASCSELTEGRPFRFRFGRAGLLSRLERPWSGDALSTLRYHAHGGLHELKHVVGEGWEEDWTTTISAADYDRSGNPRRVQNQHSLGYWDIVTGETHFDDNFTTEETYEYDGADRLTRVVARGDDSRVERRVFFDVNGRPVLEITRQTPDDDDPDEVRRQTVRNTFSGQALRRTEVVWSEPDETARRRHTTVYGYDLFGRLTVATETLDHSEEGGGRWARATEYTYGVTDLPLGQRTIEWRGDERVLVETVENGYDVSGRLASSASRLYARPRFGVEGFWATALLAAAEASDFVSAVLSPGQPLEEKELFFVHAGGDLIAVLDKDGRPVEEYLVGPGINNRLAVRYKPPDEADRLVASYHFDRTGSSLLLTRTDGEIVEEFSQAATIAGGSYRSDRYVHSGMWLDPATGLFQAGSRVLRPASGQFLSSDPLGLSGGGATYAFAANDRPRLADPTGQHPVLVLVAFVAGNVLLDLVVDFAIARWTRSRFDPDRSLVENVVLNVLTAGTGLGKLAKLRHTSRFVRVLAKTAIRHRRPLAFALEVAGGAAFEAATTGRSFGATLAGASLGAAGLAGGLKGLRALAYGSQHLHRMAFNSPVRRFRDKVDELSGLAELELPGAMGVKAYLYLRRQGGFKMAGEFGASSAVEVVRHHFGDAIAELHQQVEYVTARGILTLVARLGPDAFRSIVRRPANFGTRVHAAIKVEFQETLLAAERTLDDVKLEALHLFMKKESTYLGDVRRLTDLRPDVAFLEAVNGRAVRFFWDPTTPGQVGKVFDKYGKDPLAVFLSDVTYDRDALRALFL
jgi:RHS repeat-associated protein